MTFVKSSTTLLIISFAVLISILKYTVYLKYISTVYKISVYLQHAWNAMFISFCIMPRLCFDWQQSQPNQQQRDGGGGTQLVARPIAAQETARSAAQPITSTFLHRYISHTQMFTLRLCSECVYTILPFYYYYYCSV